MKLVIDPQNIASAQDIGGNAGDNYTKIKMSFNSLMTEFVVSSNTNELRQRMFAHTKTKAENPRMPESGVTLDQIMNLYIDFNKLALTLGSSYIKLPKWIAKKKPVINPKINNERCFKSAVIIALHHVENAKDKQCISNPQHY